MPERLPIYYDFPAHDYTIALDGVQYEVRLVYRARTASWYLDLRDEFGVPIVLGRRLSPGSSPVSGVVTNGPAGKLATFGPDPYPRDAVELWYYTAAELEAVPDDDADALPVEIEP